MGRTLDASLVSRSRFKKSHSDEWLFFACDLPNRRFALLTAYPYGYFLFRFSAQQMCHVDSAQSSTAPPPSTVPIFSAR